MFYSYFLSASALAAVSLGAVLYTVTDHGEGIVEGPQAPTSAAPAPELLMARYREQMKLTQETLRGLGYISGPIDGIMGSGTAAALRAFQQQQGLRTTGSGQSRNPRRARDRRQAEARAATPIHKGSTSSIRAHRFAAAPGPFCPPTDTGRRSTSPRSARA